ncbi:hypothetical protein RR11_2092 [Ruegeria sp. R11]|nr:hypothetical protein RR11_2092 [Ruegeria sp. R11]
MAGETYPFMGSRIAVDRQWSDRDSACFRLLHDSLTGRRWSKTRDGVCQC